MLHSYIDRYALQVVSWPISYIGQQKMKNLHYDSNGQTEPGIILLHQTASPLAHARKGKRQKGTRKKITAKTYHLVLAFTECHEQIPKKSSFIASKTVLIFAVGWLPIFFCGGDHQEVSSWTVENISRFPCAYHTMYSLPSVQSLACP